MNKSFIRRLILDVIIFLAVLNGWWFIALPLVLISTWFFPYFVEGIVAGIMYDSLFGLIPELGMWGYMGTIVATLVMVIITTMKGKVR
jgi:hypothetical protein